jgi:Rrf2 family protein
MIYSKQCAYAIRALTRLTMVRPNGYVLLDELCEGTDLPRHFVAKIFQDLVRKGLLQSAKGRGGGFALARKPDKIMLYEIVGLIDGHDQFEDCVVGMSKCDDQQPCPQHDDWVRIRAHIRKFLQDTDLQQMADTYSKKLELIGMKLPEPKSRSKPVQIP